MVISNKNDLREMVKRTEIKRVAERLSKRELCTAFNINYNFYMNCVSDRNVPSEKMLISVRKYLETPTTDVYRTVFSHREVEEGYHEKLYIDKKLVKAVSQEMKDSGVLTEPVL